jgi:hypothetical protein
MMHVSDSFVLLASFFLLLLLLLLLKLEKNLPAFCVFSFYGDFKRR